MGRPRVAIAHDYLTQRGGAERVVLALAAVFPEAPVYTTLYEPDGTYPGFADLDIRASHLNRVGLLRRHHRAALPLLPLASSSVQIDADLVIASSSGWAHGFRTTGRKLVYCYTPARWLYEQATYLGERPSPWVRTALRALEPGLVAWDRRAARSADHYLAISTAIQDRIARVYDRASDVVFPPSSVAMKTDLVIDSPRIPAPGYFLVVSRLLPYKNVARVVDAFRLRPEQRLVVVGRGPEGAELRRTAPSNVTFLEGLDDAEMAAAYVGCRGLVAASHEDFGLTPLEAASYGRPTAALRAGGYLDTIVEGSTGVFFDSPDAESIAAAVDTLAGREWDETVLVERAAEFDQERFAAQIRAVADGMLAAHREPEQGGALNLRHA